MYWHICQIYNIVYYATTTRTKEKNRPKYTVDDVEFKEIGDEGCNKLSKEHNPDLQDIKLCKGFITYEGNNNINT